MTTLSITAENLSEFEGKRISKLGDTAIFLILDGQRHLVPNPTTANNLFGPTDTVDEVLDLDTVPPGDQLTNGAILASAHNDPKVYFVSNNCKRHVVSSAAMSKYGFDGVIRDVEILSRPGPRLLKWPCCTA